MNSRTSAGCTARRALAVACAAAVAAAFAGGCAKDKGTSAAPAVPVLVADAVSADVPVKVPAIGTVEASNTVAVTARASGEIIEVGFREGGDVRKGDLLFQIDPAPYRAALVQAEANLERDRARQTDADADLARYRDLVAGGYVTQAEFGSVQATALAAEATVKADSAAVEMARLNLEYCTIRAPIGGRTGQVRVKQGSTVAPGNTGPLVTINQVAPVHVSFAVPERYLADVQLHQHERALAVVAFAPADTAAVHTGQLFFIDNAVDTETGTINLKAAFPNENRDLWPGQFVRVELVLATELGATVVPSAAVEASQQGNYVYVVKPDNTVEMRQVITGTKLDDKVVIASGVAAGEKVVTDGQLRLRPGAKVSIKSDLSPASPGGAGR